MPDGQITATDRPGKKALVIGGGAPNSALIAGALVAFIDCGVTFDVISTSGAGALMGLLYTAPRGGRPREALSRWPDIGVADGIYDWFPVNYKVFMKPGAAAEAYRKALADCPLTRPFVDVFSTHAVKGLWADAVRLWLASWSPTDLTPSSTGLCAPLPFVEQAIDFTRISKIGPDFYVGAYDTESGRMAVWGKDEINPDTLRAAFAFPFIYPPYRRQEGLYVEGAALQTLNFAPLVSDGRFGPARHQDVDTIVVLDILGTQKLLQPPRDLYDSWVKSIITPLVQAARNELLLFELKHNSAATPGTSRRAVLIPELTADIPEDHWPKVLDWSASNMRLLFEAGYAAGVRFCAEHGEVLKRQHAWGPSEVGLQRGRRGEAAEPLPASLTPRQA